MKLTRRRLRLYISLILFAVGALGFVVSPAKQQAVHIAQQQNPGLYQVDHDVDGDTIVVKTDGKTETVRLIGVDTPEEKDRRKPVQCFAEAAANFTKQQVEGKQVRLEADSISDNRDRYGRMLRYVYLPDGTLLNKAIIEQGYGFAMTSFPHSKMDEFRTSAQQAHQQNRGLWGNCSISESTGYPQTNPVN